MLLIIIIRTLIRERPTPISREPLESPVSESFPTTTESKPSPSIVWFRPRDKKLPLVAIPVDQAPKGFLQYHEEYQKRLFVATIRRWSPTSLHPFGTLDREIGLIGELVSEEQAILADNNIHNDGFTEQSLKCLPAVPWPIPIQETKLRRDVNGPGTRVFTMSRDFKHGEPRTF
jgi:exoribonuclease R